MISGRWSRSMLTPREVTFEIDCLDTRCQLESSRSKHYSNWITYINSYLKHARSQIIAMDDEECYILCSAVTSAARGWVGFAARVSRGCLV